MPEKTINALVYLHKHCNQWHYCLYILCCARPGWVSHSASLYLQIVMPKTPAKKLQALRQSGTLNPAPEKVRHPLFAESVFFDANDLLQTKYEMLRAIQVDGRSIAGAAAEFGLSRPTVYEVQAHFKARGLEGLLPEKRGPKHPHKLTPEVMKAVLRWRSEQPEIGAAELVVRVRERWRVAVHPRTLEKALASRAKRGRPRG